MGKQFRFYGNECFREIATFCETFSTCFYVTKEECSEQNMEYKALGDTVPFIALSVPWVTLSL